MKYIAIWFPVLALVSCFWISGNALAAPAPRPQAGMDLPQARDRIGAVPLDQMFASLSLLGQWQLPTGPRLQVMSYMTKNGGECTDPDSTPATCPHYGLLVSLFDWSSHLADPALFRGPEKLIWKMMSDKPRKLNEGDNNDPTEYALDLLTCEAPPRVVNEKTDYDWHGVRYTLDFTAGLVTDPKTGYAHWSYTVKLVPAPEDGIRLTCAGTPKKP